MATRSSAAWRDRRPGRRARAPAYCNFGGCVESEVHLPRDAAPHKNITEWWYYTGHVSDGVRSWGYQVTIFQALIGKASSSFAYMCHVAVSDLVGGAHYHIDSISVTPTQVGGDPVVVAVDNCSIQLGGDGHDHIRGIIPEGKEKDHHPGSWTVELDLVPQKHPAMHGGKGIEEFGEPDNFSYYYSYTRMQASGTVKTSEGEFDVSGISWMDHQWGDFNGNAFKGWDWWSMQFDDGYEIMLSQVRDWNNVLVGRMGTIVDPQGNLTGLAGLDAFGVASKRSWASPHTDGIYPLDWDVTIGTMNFSVQVRTSIDDQEMYNPIQNYWEGAVTLSGSRGGKAIKGVGYVELTGYATDATDPKH